MPGARTYDPVSEVQKLRDHLAGHDDAIALLLGAGTSCAVKATDDDPLIPAVARLTELCREAVEALGEEFKQGWESIKGSLPDDRRDIEEILTAVRRMLEVLPPGDEIAGLDADQLKQVETKIKATIAKNVIPKPDRVPDELPHRSLGRWLGNVARKFPVEIFTLNYDTLVERGLEQEWVPLFDGFVGAHEPFFSAASLVRSDMRPGPRWARLWKIHGSVTWRRSGEDPGSRIVRGPETTDGEMILPSLRKYEESRKQPYMAMLDRLRGVLTQREKIALIVCGYSYSDQHINEVIVEALEANPGLHVFFLSFSQPDVDSPLAKAAREQRRLILIGPEGAVVGGEYGEWSVVDPDAAEQRLKGIFEPSGAGNPGGTLKLGDFNIFCALLDLVAQQSTDG